MRVELYILITRIVEYVLTNGVNKRETMYLLIPLPLKSGNVRISDVNQIGAYLAKQRIELEGLIDPSQFTIDLDFIDDHCDGTYALEAAIAKYYTKLDNSMIREDDGPQYVTSVIGMICNQVCRPVGSFYGAVSVPTVSIGCNADILSSDEDDESYNSFGRVVASWNSLVDITLQLLEYYKWKTVAIISLSDPDWLGFATALKNTLESKHIFVDMNHTITDEPVDGFVNFTGSLYNSCLKAIGKLGGSETNPIRIYIFLLEDAEIIACLMALYRLDWAKTSALISYGFSIDHDGKRWYSASNLNYMQKGLISINLLRPEKEWKKFDNLFTDYYSSNQSIIKTPRETELSIYAGLLYDAVLLWGYSANKSLIATKETGFMKEEIPYYFQDVEFEGATGKVRMGPNGDRLCDYAVEIVDYDLKYTKLFEYTYDTKKLVLTHFKNDFTWPGESRQVPNSEYCPGGNCQKGKKEANTVVIVTSVVFGTVFLILALIAFLCYRKAQRETIMRVVNAWIIKWDDIICNTPEKEHMYTSAVERVIVHEVSRVIFGVDNLNQKNFSDVGYFKGIVVCIKPVEQKSVEQLDAVMISELRNMINLKHENLNLFVGICLDEPNVCMLTLYAKQGSLHNVLVDDDMDLPLEFKLSFAIDISKGMEYLHTSVIGSHGHLSSTNCVVDKKWTCKVTDYGMGEFQKMKIHKEDENASNHLWTAPEILRLAEGERPLYGSQKGDVYSYGIILQELALRSIPFSIERKELDIVDVLAKVAVALNPPFRPSVPENACSVNWRMLMVSCWDEKPEERPAFKKITAAVRKLSKGKTINIIDNMLEKLEKHAQHLEFLVAERTNEINVEKKRVDSLLYTILPKTVADSLLKRGYVDPEMFESVTVYFSDIVGFNKIGQNSTALQVVDLLNALYTCFDEITDKYDVYKCETIGDVYMVASGLPVRNGERHAPEITTMALHLLSAISTFKIPHMPGEILQLRIGLHTGSVVAGVVGLKMPHYCLFGDTVNTASRMQSGGLALRIHISNVTANILIATGKFILENRGERAVKGKGIMTTYWVLGKKGFNMPMPDLSKAAKPEEHDFK